ncbi:MAG: hypothetical protein Rubg2KO_38420 [Rubricoccaceae bacterium]
MNTAFFFGSLIVMALVVSAMLGWVADLRRVRGAMSASETRAQHRDQSERIRGAYMSKEQRAREMRERIRRERKRRERAREAQGYRPTSGPSSGSRASSDRPSAPRISSTEDLHRETLELVGEITPELLRRNYRRLVAAYHPDRCAGLGEKLQRLAEEETKSINEAYSFFKRQLGL